MCFLPFYRKKLSCSFGSSNASPSYSSSSRPTDILKSENSPVHYQCFAGKGEIRKSEKYHAQQHAPPYRRLIPLLQVKSSALPHSVCITETSSASWAESPSAHPAVSQLCIGTNPCNAPSYLHFPHPLSDLVSTYRMTSQGWRVAVEDPEGNLDTTSVGLDCLF